MTQGLTGRAWETGLGAQQARKGPQGARRGEHGRPQYGQLGHDTAHDKAKGGHDMADSARACGLAGGLCRDIQFCIVTEARDWSLGVVSRYSLCIVTSGQFG